MTPRPPMSRRSALCALGGGLALAAPALGSVAPAPDGLDGVRAAWLAYVDAYNAALALSGLGLDAYRRFEAGQVDRAELDTLEDEIERDQTTANRAANAAEDRLVAAIRALGPNVAVVNLGHKLIALGPDVVPFDYPDAFDLDGSRVLDYEFAGGEAVGIPGVPSGHDPAAALPVAPATRHAGPYSPKVARKIRPHVAEMRKLQAEAAGEGRP